VAFEIVWEARGACKRFFGHVSDDDLMESVADIEGDPRFDDLRYVINDFLGVASFAITEENVLAISAIDAAAAISNPNIKIAVVATDLQVQALAKVYATSPWNAYPTAVFSNIEEARAWL
jgi:hypothetical protein